MKATSRSGLLVGVALVSIAVVSGFVFVPSTGFVAHIDGSKGTVCRCTTTSACGLFYSTSVLHSRRSSRHDRVSSLSMSTPNGGQKDTGDSQVRHRLVVVFLLEGLSSGVFHVMSDFSKTHYTIILYAVILYIIQLLHDTTTTV